MGVARRKTMTGSGSESGPSWRIVCEERQSRYRRVIRRINSRHTATAAAVAAATAAAAVTAAASATTAARGPRSRFVDSETTAVVILAIQALDGREGLVVIVHLHEAESPTPTGLAVAQDLGAAHGPVLLEQFLKLLRSDRVLEVANVKPLRHRNRPEKALHRPQGTKQPRSRGADHRTLVVSHPPAIEPGARKRPQVCAAPAVHRPGSLFR